MLTKITTRIKAFLKAFPTLPQKTRIYIVILGHIFALGIGKFIQNIFWIQAGLNTILIDLAYFVAMAALVMWIVRKEVQEGIQEGAKS